MRLAFTPILIALLACSEATGGARDAATDAGTDAQVDAAEPECIVGDPQKKCVLATASKCDSGKCVECQIDDDCTGLSGLPRCASGVCVTCLPATEEQDCGTKSCDPVAHECTSTERDSVGNCEKCKADSECHENFRCVPMNYMDVERGGYCLKDAAVSGCSQPFSVGITATSLSGEPEAQYCGIKQSLTTCEAVLARVNACPGDNPNECAPEGADCKTIELVQHKCTYPCDTSLQCETGMTCGSGYCGGPVI